MDATVARFARLSEMRSAMAKGLHSSLSPEFPDMSDLPQPFPLAWPENVPRAVRQTSSAFKTSLSGALNNVHKSLEMFGRDTGSSISSIVLSSNVGGLEVKRPQDPGVAAWFLWEKQLRCIAVDRYEKVEDNLQAIHHILEARRTEMRHGGLNIVRQTFKAFAALPGPKTSASRRQWFHVLGVKQDDDIATLEAAYKKRAREAHPDAGGSSEAMSELNVAIMAARKAKA